MVAAKALSQASPTLPTDGSTIAFAKRPVERMDAHRAATVAVADQTALLNRPARIKCLFKRIQNKVCFR